MSRELEFRIWDPQRKSYVRIRNFHSFIEDGPAEGMAENATVIFTDRQRKEHVYNVALKNVSPEQYTGRLDDSPKKTKIYDGSKIKVTAESHVIGELCEAVEPFDAIVFWQEHMLCWFYEECLYGEGGHPLANCNCEVIGTIHDKE